MTTKLQHTKCVKLNVHSNKPLFNSVLLHIFRFTLWSQYSYLGIHALFPVLKKCITDHICTLFVNFSHHQYSVATWHIA